MGHFSEEGSSNPPTSSHSPLHLTASGTPRHSLWHSDWNLRLIPKMPSMSVSVPIFLPEAVLGPGI